MLCAIWYHLDNLKNVKNVHEGVLLLLKVTLLHGCFLRVLNCTNGTKSQQIPTHHVCSTSATMTTGGLLKIPKLHLH